MEKAETKMAPSTPTLSIPATISSPVTCSGQFGTLCQGRCGVLASYAWTWASIMAIGEAPLCSAVAWYGNLWRPSAVMLWTYPWAVRLRRASMVVPLGQPCTTRERVQWYGRLAYLGSILQRWCCRGCCENPLTSRVSLQMPTLAKVQLQSRLGPLHHAQTARVR